MAEQAAAAAVDPRAVAVVAAVWLAALAVVEGLAADAPVKSGVNFDCVIS